MKTIQALLLIHYFAFMSLAGDPENLLHFRINGFSIAPLEATATANFQVLSMLLPVTESFAPSVGVQIQFYKGKIEEYVELSQQQFQAIGVKILSETISKNEVVWEYTGTFQGRSIHFYSKAISIPDKIYLVTAVATASQWEQVAHEMKDCVDSFQLDTAPPRQQAEKRAGNAENRLYYPMNQFSIAPLEELPG